MKSVIVLQVCDFLCRDPVYNLQLHQQVNGMGKSCESDVFCQLATQNVANILLILHH